jgi:ubiquinone/menaquinone biosynthesis C-methylase UbiE
MRPHIFCVFLLTGGTVPTIAQHEYQQGRGEHQVHRHTADHRFADAERWSAMFDNPERDAWQKPAEVVGLRAAESGMTVADLGAGTGYFLGYLGDAGRVLGLDPEPDMVRFMRERAEKEGWSNVEAREIPFDDPALEPGSVALVASEEDFRRLHERPKWDVLHK